MGELIDQWIAWLRDVRRLSDETIRSYRQAADSYVAVLERRGRRLTGRKGARTTDVEAWVATLASHTAGSVATRLWGVRSLHVWLVREGHRKDNPTLDVKTPRAERKLVRTPSVDQVNALREAFDPRTVDGLRGRALIACMYGCGMRHDEVRELNDDDVDLGRLRVHVRGKGAKDRIVPIPATAARDLADWIELRPAFDGAMTFPGRRAGGARSERLGQGSINTWLEQAARRAKIGRRIYPHLLRHAFATHLLAAGVNLEALRQLLGHEDIRTTAMYLHLEAPELARIVQSHHPFGADDEPRTYERARLRDSPWSRWPA